MKYLIIIASTIGLLFIAITIIVGARTFEGTVVQDPYESAAHWDSARHDQQQSGWHVSVMTKIVRSPVDEFSLEVRDRRGEPVDASIELHITVPFTNRYDRDYHMEPDREGIYRTPVNVPVRGRWLAHITIVKAGKRIAFDERFDVE